MRGRAIIERDGRKWQYQRVRYLKQEGTRGALPIGSSKFPVLVNAPNAVSYVFPTELAEPVEHITAAR